MASSSLIYEQCLVDVNNEDPLLLIQCLSSRLEGTGKLTAETMRSYLMVLCGAFVFFMQAGFAMLCAGSVRRKNTQNTMLKNLLDAAGAAFAYFCVGYGFAFGGDFSRDYTSGQERITFIGLDNFFGTGDFDLAFFFFQYTFTAASVTIVAGTLAERCQMAAYLCYSIFLTGFVYPVVAHAVWSVHGYLSPNVPNPLLGIGVVDFSGSGVVHLTGGITALHATYILGSRRGRFYDVNTGEPLETPKPFPGHSVSLQMLGSFILWFGWFGFNPGTALLLTDNPHQADIAALCAVNTFLSSAGGCISALLLKMFMTYRETGMFSFDLVAAMNGTLTGLVSITGGCAVMDLWAAIIVGIVAGILYCLGSEALIRVKIDDAVDAVPVHCLGGLWGLLSVGLLGEPTHLLRAYGTDAHPGFFYSMANGTFDARLLACQVICIIAIIAWATITMLPFFLWLNFMGWFRSGSIQELVGLDVTYNLDGGVGALAENNEEDVREEYLDAYQRYRENLQKRNGK